MESTPYEPQAKKAESYPKLRFPVGRFPERSCSRLEASSNVSRNFEERGRNKSHGRSPLTALFIAAKKAISRQC